MRCPLKYQLLVPWLAVTLLAVVALSGVGALLASQRVRSDVRTNLRNIANTLVEANFPIEDSVLRQASGLSNAKLVTVDDEGGLNATSQPNLSLPADSPQITTATALELKDTATLGNETFFHAVVQLDRRPVGGRLEQLHIFYPERQLREARWQAVWPPLLAGVVATASLLLVATLLAGRITQPIEQLGRHAENIAHGKFNAIDVPHRDDEIRDLVLSINRMTAMLARYEEEVRRNERLRTLGQLGGGIAHQIRNAVTGCRMALDLHARECRSSADGGETMQVATRQLQLIERYLQRFLTLGQAAATKCEQVDLVALVHNVLPLVSGTAQHVGVGVTIEATSEAIVVSGDPHALEQILVNLLLNAIEAASAGGAATGHVLVRLSSDDEVVLIDVIDNGPGVSAAVRAKLFEPFASDKADGVGLGLSTARDLARSQRGDLEFCETTAGACFRVRLPR